MKAIFQLFWDICLFRTSPEAVPTQRFFIGLVIIIYAVVELIHFVLVSELSAGFHLLLTAFSLGFVSLASWGALRIWSLQERFAATIIAIIGTDIIMSMLLTAYLYCLRLLDITSMPEESPIQMVTGLVILMIMFWDIVVKGFIFEKSLETSRLNGVFFSLALSIVVLRVGYSLMENFEKAANVAEVLICSQELVVV